MTEKCEDNCEEESLTVIREMDVEDTHFILSLIHI